MAQLLIETASGIATTTRAIVEAARAAHPDAAVAGGDGGGDGAPLAAAALVATTTDANAGTRSAGERSLAVALDLLLSRCASAGEDRSGGGPSEASACPAISARAARRPIFAEVLIQQAATGAARVAPA